MTTFALKYIDEVAGKVKIFKLLLNNKCEFDEFEKQVQTEGSYSSELVTIQTRLQDIADGKLLPKEKFRNITGYSGDVDPPSPVILTPLQG